MKEQLGETAIKVNNRNTLHVAVSLRNAYLVCLNLGYIF
jgi:hypothetical protein